MRWTISLLPWANLVLAVSLTPIQEADPYFHTYTTGDGLSHNSISTILQDEYHYLWIGTSNGLVVYDGKKFIKYQKSAKQEHGPSGNNITAILEVEAGTLWIGTKGQGLNRLTLSTRTFKAFRQPDAPKNEILCLLEDPNRPESLWVGTAEGLFRFDSKEENFQPLTLGQHPSGAVTALALDQEGRVWAGTSAGLYVMRREDAQFRHVLQPPGAAHITCMYVDESGALWMGTSAGILLLPNPENGTGQAVLPQLKGITALQGDQFGEIWIGTEKQGLGRYVPAAGHLSVYSDHEAKDKGFKDEGVACLYQDNNGVVWVGGKHSGLHRLSLHVCLFNHYLHENKHQTSSRHHVRHILAMGDETFWIGTDHGLYHWNRNTEESRIYGHEAEKADSLSSSKITRLARDPQSRTLWVGTVNGLNLFNLADGKAVRYLQATTMDVGAIHALCPNPNGNGELWVGSEKGLFWWDPSSAAFSARTAWPAQDTAVTGVLMDSAQQLWVATPAGGVRRLDPQSGASLDFPLNDSNHTEERVVRVMAFDLNDPTLLWIGTARGLVLLNTEDGTYQRFNDPHGLPSPVINGLVPSKQGTLWLSSDHGLSRFEPERGHFTHYDKADGLQENTFYLGAASSAENGEIFFGGNDGFTGFFPGQIPRNETPPKVVINGFKLNGKDASHPHGEDAHLSEHIAHTPEITLTHEHDLFAFEFAALQFERPDKSRYRYRLSPFQKEWVEPPPNDREADFTNLDPGKYVFTVHGSNRDGTWSEAGASVGINVLPHPLISMRAKVFYAITLVVCLVFYFKTQRDKLSRERAIAAHERKVATRLKQLDKLKDEFLANTSHELRTPLHGIVGLTEGILASSEGAKLSLRMRESLDMVINSSRRLTNLVNGILDFSKLKNNQLELKRKHIGLYAVADVVLHLSRPLAEQKGLTLHNQIPRSLTVYADEDRVTQILHNLVGNAVKFTHVGSVCLRAEPQDDVALIMVEDTGIGIPVEQHETVFQSFVQGDGTTARTYGGTGLGLSISKNLVELHGGTISLDSAPGKGTRMRFTLPRAESATADLQQPDEPPHRRMGAIAGTPNPDMEPPPERLQLQPLTEADQAAPSKLNKRPYRILLVDDEVVNLHVLRGYLEEYYPVLTAADGPSALAVLDEQEVDLVLLDLMMPRMSGYEVCRKIREHHLVSELPVIMLTAKDQIGDLLEGFSSGANDYLTKPFSREELLARIQTHLDLRHIHHAAGRFVPTEFLRTLGRETITDVRLGDQVSGKMTIMFADIRAYTTLSESMTPKENFAFLNAYLGRIGPVILRHNGFVNQYYGDGIMAIFPKSPEDALAAARDMHAKVRNYNEEREAAGRSPIRIGIGLHTGHVMLGIIGDDRRTDSGVVADTVNTAARMEGLTKIYAAEVIVSETTVEGLAPKAGFHLRRLDRVRVKGKKVPLAIYELIDALPEAQRLQRSAAVNCFRDALAAYFSANFTKAEQLLRRAMELDPQDGAAALLLERTQALQAEGVAENWDGVADMKTK